MSNRRSSPAASLDVDADHRSPRDAVVIACSRPRPLAVPGRPARDSYAFGGRIIPADGGSLAGRPRRRDRRARQLRGDRGLVRRVRRRIPGAAVGSGDARACSAIPRSPRYHPSIVTLGPGVPARRPASCSFRRTGAFAAATFDGRDVRDRSACGRRRVRGDGPGYWRLTKRGGSADAR